MPLPAALQAKLLKRGIIKHRRSDTEPEEEIIAEDYDDHQITEEYEKPRDIITKVKLPAVENKENKLAIGCPNKWNVYHECTNYCLVHWADGIKTPNPNDEKKRLRMLKKYPLPETWQEIFDPGTGRYYYWHLETDEVSWLPPKHPRAKVSVPASHLREIIRREEQTKKKKKHESNEHELEEETREERHHDDRHERRRERERDRERDRSRGRSRHRENDLDPMDPAAYSDTPRGTWSSGLERKGEAKTGADTTASGPLYQMRPYPSPGAVLRANAELQAKEKN